MRRGFLFGIGTFLIIGTLAGLLEVWKGGTLDIVVGALMIATCAPMSVWRSERQMKLNQTNLGYMPSQAG